MVACYILAASASPIEFEDLYEQRLYGKSFDFDLIDEPVLFRSARSPQGGNLNVGVTKDDFGRHANVDYTHNLYSSSDGHGSIDAYAQATRNFDSNRNDFNGGIRGSWRF